MHAFGDIEIDLDRSDGELFVDALIASHPRRHTAPAASALPDGALSPPQLLPPAPPPPSLPRRSPSHTRSGLLEPKARCSRWAAWWARKSNPYPPSFTVPTEFLEAHTDYKFEVLAIEAGANQTITEGTFSTQ